MLNQTCKDVTTSWGLVCFSKGFESSQYATEKTDSSQVWCGDPVFWCRKSWYSLAWGQPHGGVPISLLRSENIVVMLILAVCELPSVAFWEPRTDIFLQRVGHKAWEKTYRVCKALKFMKGSKCLLQFMVWGESGGKDFKPKRGSNISTRNRLGKCGFHFLPVLCSGRWARFRRVYQTTLLGCSQLFFHWEALSMLRLLTWNACGGRGREEFLSSRCYCVLLCFVSVQFVSRIREMTQKVISTIGEHGKTQTLVS